MSPTPDDGSGPLDVDAAFAEIVAHWGEDVRAEDAAPPAGAPEDTAGTAEVDGADEVDRAEPRPGPRAEARTVRPATPLPPPPREDVPPFAPEQVRFEPPSPARGRDDEPDELAALGGSESFVPAEPEPLPRDVLGWAAWIAVIGSPLFLLVVALGWRDVPQLVTGLTAAVFVAGFATLVVRLPSSRDDDDDDGAVV